MADVTIDIQDGQNIRENEQGWQTTRVALVTGLTGDAPGRMYQAMSDANLPQYGEAHPSLTSLSVIDRFAEALSGTQVRVTLTYGRPPSGGGDPSESSTPQISVGTVLELGRTTEDKDGNAITVEHEFSKTRRHETYTWTETQAKEVDLLIPRTQVRFTRREPGDPRLKSQVYAGAVNSNTFLNAAPRTWLCTRLEGVSQDGGESYTVNYEFVYKSTTWQAVVYFVDPETNAPPADLVDGVGIKDVKVYGERNLNDLNLGT